MMLSVLDFKSTTSWKGNLYTVRLILMRTRFRASDFGQVAKTNVVCANRNTGFWCQIGCGDGTRVICLFARVIQQLAFST